MRKRIEINIKVTVSVEEEAEFKEFLLDTGRKGSSWARAKMVHDIREWKAKRPQGGAA